MPLKISFHILHINHCWNNALLQSTLQSINTNSRNADTWLFYLLSTHLITNTCNRRTLNIQHHFAIHRSNSFRIFDFISNVPRNMTEIKPSQARKYAQVNSVKEPLVNLKGDFVISFGDEEKKGFPFLSAVMTVQGQKTFAGKNSFNNNPLQQVTNGVCW